MAEASSGSDAGRRSASWPTITLTIAPETFDPDTAGDLAAALAGEFAEDGIAGIWERSSPDGPTIEFVIYFEQDWPPLAMARIERLFLRNGFALPSVILGTQPREDWNETWRKGFTAFPFGRRFEVVPSWEPPSEDSGRIVLSIDPGLAFGTGTHETTQLVLEGLEDRIESVNPGERFTVVDVGTGSAILAIASLKLGCTRVFGCDLDPDAVHVARRNAERNSVDLPLWIGSVRAVRSRTADLVLANITAATIVDLLADLTRLLAPGGAMILSGILDVQETLVRDALDLAGLEVVGRRDRGEWVGLEVRPPRKGRG